MKGLAFIVLVRGGVTADTLVYTEKIFRITGDCQNLGRLIDPSQVSLTCFRVLQANEDPRTPEFLHNAYQQIQAQAEKVSDIGLRHSSLENVTSQRKFVKQYNVEIINVGNESPRN